MKVNILALSSPARFELAALEAGLKSHQQIWHKFGFETHLFPSCYVQNQYETLKPQEKWAELCTVAQGDNQIIVSLRGGYSTNFMLDYIDLEILNQYHNTLIGHSDLTILLNYLAYNTNWNIYHGPLFTSIIENDNYSLPLLKETIQGTNNVLKSQTELTIHNPNPVCGRIAGGNLSLITSAIGTKHELDLTDKILLIEDVSEPDFKVDAMMWQLDQHYNLSRLKAVIIGSFKDCTWEYSEKHRGVKKIMENYLLQYQIPIIMNYSSSHDPIMTCLPLNKQVEISETGVISII